MNRVAHSGQIGGQMDRLPLGRYHRKLVALIGGGMFLDGFELYLTAGVLVALTKEGWSDMTYNANFISLTFIGMIIGAWAAGILGDKYGRRFTYQFNLILFGVGSLLAAFAPNMEVLLALRFVMGIGLGAEVVVGYAMLSEFMPAQSRGRMIGWLAIITNSSLFISAIIGMWVIPNLGWRYMFGLVGVLAMIILFLRKTLPESPRWLESQGRHEEAAAILKKMAYENQSDLNIAVDTSIAQPKSITKSEKITVWSVFKPPVLRHTLLGILLNVVTGFCLYGFVNWLPTFFDKQGVNLTSSLLWTTVMGIGAPAGAALGMLLADRIGRKPIIVGASVLTGILGMFFSYYGADNNSTGLMIVGFLLFIGIYMILAVGFALYVPELFRTEYRLRGTAVCSCAGRFATAFVQYIVIWLYALNGLTGVLGLLISLLLIQAIAFAIFGIETAKRSLESIGNENAQPSKPFDLSMAGAQTKDIK